MVPEGHREQWGRFELGSDLQKHGDYKTIAVRVALSLCLASTTRKRRAIRQSPASNGSICHSRGSSTCASDSPPYICRLPVKCDNPVVTRASDATRRWTLAAGTGSSVRRSLPDFAMLISPMWFAAWNLAYEDRARDASRLAPVYGLFTVHRNHPLGRPLSLRLRCLTP